MKKISTVNVVVAILALFVSGQLFAEELEELDTKVVKEETTEVVNALSSPKEKGRDYLVFASIGLSRVREDIDASIGEGSQFRIAAGVQHNKWFGLECYGEVTPAIEPRSVLDDLRKNIDQTILSSRISTQGNKYLGILGKFSKEFVPDVSFFAKVGVAYFEAHQVTANLTVVDPEEDVLFSYLRLEGGVDGYSPVVSIGYEIPVPYRDSRKVSGELSLTQMFDEKVKHLSLNVTLKYTF